MYYQLHNYSCAIASRVIVQCIYRYLVGVYNKNYYGTEITIRFGKLRSSQEEDVMKDFVFAWRAAYLTSTLVKFDCTGIKMLSRVLLQKYKWQTRASQWSTSCGGTPLYLEYFEVLQVQWSTLYILVVFQQLASRVFYNIQLIIISINFTIFHSTTRIVYTAQLALFK